MALTDLPSLGFIGAGRAARAIAPVLEASGYPIVAVASRNPESAGRLAKILTQCKTATFQEVADEADLVFITPNDGAIEDVARRIAWRSGQAVVHCSGALTLSPLEAARQLGAAVGSWHPVQTFSEYSQLDALQGVTVGIEASGPLSYTLEEMARRAGATPLEVPADARPLYHAAAVMACGYMATLLHEAASLWERAGLPAEAAASALGKLAETTLANVRRTGARAALTGPAGRGDVATVLLHLSALASNAPETVPLYRALAARSAALADGGAEWNAVLMPSPEEV